MRNDLRELARLAAPAPAAAHGFDDADSSGYVDLSAFSTRDPRWVERELARAKAGGPPPPPPRSRAIDVLTPASMAPVALDSFVLKDDDDVSPRPSRAKRVLYGLGALASVGVVGYLAVVLAKHPPPPATAAQAAAPIVAAAPAVDPAPSTPAAAAAVPSVAAPPSTAVVSTPTATAGATGTTVAVAVTSPSAPARGKRAHGARSHAPAHAAGAGPTHVAAAGRPVVIPASRPSGGGDSLMDLIKKSVATGK